MTRNRVQIYVKGKGRAGNKKERCLKSFWVDKMLSRPDTGVLVITIKSCERLRLFCSARSLHRAVNVSQMVKTIVQAGHHWFNYS